MRWFFRFGLAVCAFTSVAMGADRKPTGVELSALSGDLFEVAVRMHDPLLAIAAAKLRKRIDFTPGTLVPEGATPATAQWTEWTEMLETAKAMAGGDAALLDLVDDVAAESTRGRLESPARVGGEIATGEKLIYRDVTFQGGDYAEVYVEGSGTSDLNLYIRRVGGQLICSDSDASDRIYCGWVPDQTTAFDIEITNKGDAANRYTLITN
ncbi:MAG: hypothetical protein AAF666_02225 [Pseudomonadota bacterium]